MVFFANRANLQSKRLHDRIARRLRAECSDVWRRRAEPRERGPYRVVGEADPAAFLAVETYPATSARVEVGFQLRTDAPHEYYWLSWIEPERALAVGWHRGDEHDDLGPVHVQVDAADETVVRRPASLDDSHPLDVVERRLRALPTVVRAVQWADGRPVGLDPDVLASA